LSVVSSQLSVLSCQLQFLVVGCLFLASVLGYPLWKTVRD
jgi:hypothetical protein